MPLQNRVDPFGEIHAVECARHVHGQPRRHPRPRHQDLLRRRWTTKAWIICSCEYKGTAARADGPQRARRQRRLDRTVLPRRGDGARRRPPALLLLPARGGEGIRRAASARPSASPSRRSPEIDARLHAERLASGGNADQRSTADGIASAARRRDGLRRRPGATPCASGRRCAWTFRGLWRAPCELGDARRSDAMRLITPPTTLAVLEGRLPAGLASDDPGRRR